jgi:hypothetical protein
MNSLVQRYWHSLTGTGVAYPALLAERRDGEYGLWRRYWTSLLGIRLPPSDAAPQPAAQDNPLTEPYVTGTGIRLPRFDRAAVRLAASEEPDRASARWTVEGLRFTIRESGPGEIDLLVEAEREIPPTRVLPIGIATSAGHRRYYMVFVPEATGRSVGALRLAGTSGWIDVTVDEELPAATLDATDPVVRAWIAESVAATPDPGMAAWAEIIASRPLADPLREVIEDAAG